MRAGLLAGAGLHCRRTAISGGPASAKATAIPASDQPSPDDAASPGITAMARPAPASAAGTVATRAPRSIIAATCRSEPPLARSMASSSSLRTTIILAVRSMTAAPITIRLTNSSNSTVSMPAWVPRNADRGEPSGELTLSVAALQRPGRRGRRRLVGNVGIAQELELAQVAFGLFERPGIKRLSLLEQQLALDHFALGLEVQPIRPFGEIDSVWPCPNS